MFVPSYFFISSAIACGRGRPGHGRCTRRPPCVHHLRSLNKEDGSSLLSGILVTSKVTHLGSAVESRERMGSPTLQTHQDPILLLPWLCSRGGGFPNPRYSVSKHPDSPFTASFVVPFTDIGGRTANLEARACHRTVAREVDS